MRNDSVLIVHQHYILDHLTIYKYRFFDSNTFNNPDGRAYHALCYITSGEVAFIDKNGRQFTAFAGDVVFLPKGLIYESVWTGHRLIEYYTIDFGFSHRTIQIATPQMSLSPIRNDIDHIQPQVIDHKQVTGQMRLYFAAILSEYVSGRCSGSLLAISDFYRLWQIFLSLTAYDDSRVLPSGMRQSPVFPAILHIEQHYADTINVGDLARMCDMSESRFYSIFKSCTGTSPIDYRNRLRIHIAAQLLQSGQYSVAGVSEALNFSNPGYFRQIFRQYTGHNPGEFIKTQSEQPLGNQI